MKKTEKNERKPQGETVLVLKNLDYKGYGYGGFVYPKKGFVECEDFNDKPICGNGLHGFLWGIGDFSLLYDEKGPYGKGHTFLIIEVEKNKIIELDGKVKFPYGWVVCYGGRQKCTDYLLKRLPEEYKKNPNVLGQKIYDDNYYRRYTSCVNVLGHSISHYGNAVSGDYGISKTIDGIAVSGDDGSCEIERCGVGVVKHGGKIKAGEGSVIVFMSRYNGIITGKIGENGLKPNVYYTLWNDKIVSLRTCQRLYREEMYKEERDKYDY